MKRLVKVTNGQKSISIRITNLVSQVTPLWPKMWGFL